MGLGVDKAAQKCGRKYVFAGLSEKVELLGKQSPPHNQQFLVWVMVGHSSTDKEGEQRIGYTPAYLFMHTYMHALTDTILSTWYLNGCPHFPSQTS